jgi:hypothetical protein
MDGRVKQETSSERGRFHFILIVNDPDTADRMSAYELATARLRQGAWPIYARTRHRQSIRAGDLALIYVAGGRRFSQTFFATATVGFVELIGRRQPRIDPEEIVAPPTSIVLRLAHVARFDPPVSIRPMLKKLSFVPRSKKWGAALMGGCRMISAEDFRMIARQAAASPRLPALNENQSR